MTSRERILMICLSGVLVCGQAGTSWAQDDQSSDDAVSDVASGDNTGADGVGSDRADATDADNPVENGAGDGGSAEDLSTKTSRVDLEKQNDSGSREDERPWAANVASEARATATELFLKGNQALDVGDFGGAEEAFMNALAHWNHPAIQYNLVLALIGKKDDPVRIYKALQEAIRFGEAPLESANYKQALQYENIYSGQLATLELRCDEPDTQVTLDGRPVLTGPGKFRDYVTATEHLISATKAGYIAINKTVKPQAEKSMELDLVMYTLADKTRYERLFSPWMPWTTASSGVALLAVAGTLHYFSLQNREAYQQKVEDECPMGCPQGFDQSLLKRANLQQTSAYVIYGVGGVAAVVGTVLVFLNRPKKIVEIGNEDLVQDENLALVPIIAPDRVGIGAVLSF